LAFGDLPWLFSLPPCCGKHYHLDEDTVKAFILAGGVGTRLRPLTEDQPKPLLPFANVPLARHTVRLLQQQGVTEFIFLLYYLPEAFPPLLGDGADLGCRIEYVSLSDDRGTAGCVKHVEKKIEQTSLIFSGDLVADLNLAAMLQWHRHRGAQITLAIRPEPLPSAYGVVQADSKGRIVRFQEKPTQAELFSNWINCGIYLVEPGFLKNFPSTVPLSFEREIFPFLAENRKAIYSFSLAGYWRDIGTPSSYLQAHADYLDGKLPAAYYQSPQSRVTERRNVIGAKVNVDSSCRIERCFIGDACIIEKSAELRNSVLWEGVRVGSGAKLSDCIVGSSARLAPGVEITGISMLAARSEIGFGMRARPKGKLDAPAIAPDFDCRLTVQAA
jgi:NDP-sugar pyrophosphorylase family protein